MEEKSRRLQQMVGRHYKIIILYVIALTIIALAIFMVIFKFTTDKSRSENATNNATVNTSAIEIENPELSVDEVQKDCLSKPAEGEDYTPTFVACIQKYIDSTSDTERLVQLYGIRANYLMMNKILSTDSYNEQILNDYLKIEELQPSVASANNLVNFARATNNSALLQQWQQTYQERYNQNNQNSAGDNNQNGKM